MASRNPISFHDDVVRVARNRELRVTIENTAKAFGAHPVTLTRRLRRADISPGHPAHPVTN